MTRRLIQLALASCLWGLGSSTAAQATATGSQLTPRMYPPAGNHPEVSIAELRADTLAPGIYNVRAIIHDGRRCPRCPDGLSCPSCTYDVGILVNEMSDAATHLVFIAAELTSQLQVGHVLRLSVRISDPRQSPYPGRRVLVGLDQLPPEGGSLTGIATAGGAAECAQALASLVSGAQVC